MGEGEEEGCRRTKMLDTLGDLRSGFGAGQETLRQQIVIQSQHITSDDALGLLACWSSTNVSRSICRVGYHTTATNFPLDLPRYLNQ